MSEAKELVGIEEIDDKVDVRLESKDCDVEEESGCETPTTVEEADEAVVVVPGLAASVVVVAEEASVIAAGTSVESARTVCTEKVLPLESTSICWI